MVTKIDEKTPSLPGWLAVGVVLGMLVWSIGSVQDWNKSLEFIQDGQGISYKEHSTPLVGVGCDCLTPGSTGYDEDNNYCSGQTVLDTVPTLTAKEYTYDWDFHSNGGDAFCGQYANGDYWISPDTTSGATTVTVQGIEGTGGFGAAQLTTADENLQIESMGLLTGANNYGNHNPSQDIVGSLPIQYSSPVTITSAILDNNECGTGATIGECAGSYMILTVLDSPLVNSQDSIRPAIGLADKTPFPYSSFDVESLPSRGDLELAVGNTLEAIANRSNHCINTLSYMSSPGVFYSEGGRAFRCRALSDEYAAGYSQTWLRDFLQLGTSSLTLDEKKTAIASLITNGVDIFHALFSCTPTVCSRNGTRVSGSGAGQFGGNFMPALLFASLQPPGNKYQQALMQERALTDTFQELQQLWLGTNGVVWGDGVAIMDASTYQETHRTYWTELWRNQCYAGAAGVCATNDTAAGPKNRRDPYGLIDGPEYNPGESYMEVTTSANKAIAVIAELMPSVNTTINWGSNLQDFSKRTQYDGVLTQVDSCAKVDPRDAINVASCDPWLENGCLHYGPSNTGVATWGPDPRDIYYSCIQVNTELTFSGGSWVESPITAGHPNYQDLPHGRFPARHGSPLQSGVGGALDYVVDESEAIFETVLPE